ncbi:YjbQ family protein [Candidatus Woesearchaeota archaeon]|nr:YjbQ family protein [Candidatus Woesearchaeota archaeon]
MKFYAETLRLDSTEKLDIMDITSEVNAILKASRVKQGLVTVFSKHTTTALRINENEPRLLQDLKLFLEQHAPSSGKYLHDDMDERDVPIDEQVNGHSHLKQIMLGTSETIPVSNGKMQLGTFQSILFIELDGPRARNVSIHIQGE